MRKGFPQASDDEVLRRVQLAHAMLLTLRGVPVIYSGDEQGFAGRGGDQDSRQDMFASQVASYNVEALLGSSATTAVLTSTASVRPLDFAAERMRSDSRVFRRQPKVMTSSVIRRRPGRPPPSAGSPGRPSP